MFLRFDRFNIFLGNLKFPSFSESDRRCHSRESLQFGPEFNEDATLDPSSLDFLENPCDMNESTRIPKDGDLLRLQGQDDLTRPNSRGRKQMMKRSNLVAKQVISIQSALGLGFISQLWVDTTSVHDDKRRSGRWWWWKLNPVCYLGNLIDSYSKTLPGLVKSCLLKEFKMIGLETLVGYRVVTPGRRSIGKVRSYTFNISSGNIESLELDSFGISIIPSSLVSTYVLRIEDIIEVLSDVVVVHKAAVSRLQRVTKFVSECSDIEQLERSDRRRRERRNGRSSRSRRKKRDINEDDDDDEDGWGIFY